MHACGSITNTGQHCDFCSSHTYQNTLDDVTVSVRLRLPCCHMDACWGVQLKGSGAPDRRQNSKLATVLRVCVAWAANPYVMCCDTCVVMHNHTSQPLTERLTAHAARWEVQVVRVKTINRALVCLTVIQYFRGTVFSYPTHLSESDVEKVDTPSVVRHHYCPGCCHWAHFCLTCQAVEMQMLF